MVATLAELARALDAAAPDVALALLGEPSFRTRRQWRWRRRGSLALEIAGTKRGRWCDHETGEGGDVLQLARRCHHGDLRAAIDWAMRFLRMSPECAWRPAGAFLPPPAPDHAGAAENARSESRAQEKGDTAALALAIWREAIDIAGTPAAAYLRGRGIDPRRLPPHAGLAGWPPTLRWHDARGALVVGVNDATAGVIRAVQTIALHLDGTPLLRDGRKVKRTFGPLRGNSARFAWFPNASGRWALAEGAETALAAAQLLGIPCAASLGASNMQHVAPPSWAREVVLVADHDDAGTGAAHEAAGRLKVRGLAVRVIRPRRPGADMADLAKEVRHE